MKNDKISNAEVWFVTGSQHLYGQETLKEVDRDSEIIAKALNASSSIPVTIVFKSVVTTPDEIYELCSAANIDKNCIGLITWMHTFSPAKMWISGLNILEKPLLHLHTQFNREIPWKDIDMDFMNLHQSAHGGREFGFICTRLGINRKVVVGFWQDVHVQKKVGIWTRAALGLNESKGLKICRFGDNMREVAVTEGDKVEAQKVLGWQISAHGVGDLVESVNSVSDEDADRLMESYKSEYNINTEDLENVLYQAKIEIGLKSFLDKHSQNKAPKEKKPVTGLC